VFGMLELWNDGRMGYGRMGYGKMGYGKMG
jgi:hypothetical protein